MHREIQLNNKQLLAMRYLMDKVTTRIGYGGAAGGGKTFLGVTRLRTMCDYYPGTRRCIARNELKKIRQSTLPSYMKFCKYYDIPQSQRGIINFQDNVIRFENSSEILFIDLEYRPSDPLYERLGSLELTGGRVEESAEVHEMGIETLLTRLGRRMNEEYEIIEKLLETFNPNKGHVYEDFWKPYKDNFMPGNRVFVPALVYDNPKISRTYIEKLEQTKSKVLRERLLHGNFDYDDTPGRLFDYDAILNIKTNPKYNGKKYITCDPSGHGKDKTIIRVRDGRECIHKVVMNDTDQSVLINKIKELSQRFGVPMRQIILDANGIGAGARDVLQCIAFVSQSSPIKPSKDSVVNYATLRDQCCFKLAEIVEQSMICIPDLDEELIQEFDVIVQINIDKDAPQRIIPKDQIKQKIGRSPDDFDTVMMRVYFDLDIQDHGIRL